MSARDEILARVRAATADVECDPASEPVEWAYGSATPMPAVVARFVERVEDYRATVERCGPDEVADRIAGALSTHGATSVVVPSGLSESWCAAARSVGTVHVDGADGHAMTPAELDATSAVVTGCAVGMAESGTIVLDHGPDQGRRALTLVPDVHVCVVRVDQIVSDVPEGVARLGRAASDRRPMTWISGPSATSDIELSRVEGVHGPRTLHVIVVG